MNVLVYTIAVGDDYWNQAKLMVAALRRFGGFGGEIRIYTERDDVMDGAIVIRLPDLLVMPRPQMGKAYIGKTLDCSPYDKIVWMDCDVLAIRDVAPIFELEGCRVAGETIITHEDYIPFFGIPEHPAPLGVMGVNTGLVLDDADQWNAMCQAWWNGLMDARGWQREKPFYDQCVFNHLLNHGTIRSEAIPLGVMHFLVPGSTAVQENTVFVHTRSPLKLAVMRCLFGLLEQYENRVLQHVQGPARIPEGDPPAQP